jgi:hypothetical protein
VTNGSVALTLTYFYRKHLDELKYPAPRTVSKLVDQVSIPPHTQRLFWLTGLRLVTGLPILDVGVVWGRLLLEYFTFHICGDRSSGITYYVASH